MLGNLGYKTSVTTISKLRSVIKAKMSVLEIKAYSKTGEDLNIINSYVPNGEWNIMSVEAKVI